MSIMVTLWMNNLSIISFFLKREKKTCHPSYSFLLNDYNSGGKKLLENFSVVSF